jgi:hypothetical protein
MSELAMQAHGLILQAVIGASMNEPPSVTTAMLARIIVSEAKKLRPDDLRLQSLDLDSKSPDWNDISAAMNVVVKTLDGSTQTPAPDSLLEQP